MLVGCGSPRKNKNTNVSNFAYEDLKKHKTIFQDNIQFTNTKRTRRSKTDKKERRKEGKWGKEGRKKKKKKQDIS